MKTILLTGATDGIGLEAAKLFAKEDFSLILHGRNTQRLENARDLLLKINPKIDIQLCKADFSNLQEVHHMAEELLQKGQKIDVLINNAGVFVVDDKQVIIQDGLDIRFSVNTIAPYILTNKLLPLLSENSRVINLSSAAQAPIDFKALQKGGSLSHSDAYAQSKLAITMWTMVMAKNHPPGPIVLSVNPKSFLGSKMVKEAYGQQGYDLEIGASLLYRAAFSAEFSNANGAYYDNDYQRFSSPHPFAQNQEARLTLMSILDTFM